MKRKFKQWQSTISLISTKQTTTSHFISLNIKKITLEGIGLGQAQQWGGAKPVYGTPPPLSCIQSFIL